MTMHKLSKILIIFAIVIGLSVALGVYINPKIDNVEFGCNYKEIYIGDYFELSANTNPSQANKDKLTWRSSNQDIAKISGVYSHGCSIFANAIGTATITVSAYGEIMAVCEIKVKPYLVEQIECVEFAKDNEFPRTFAKNILFR